ncbi:MAG: hypothetical protein WAU07_04900 [Microgenomates group bacterium]
MDKKINLKSGILLVATAIVWRILLFYVADTAPLILEYKPSFPYYDTILEASNYPKWLYSWANFDGVHYITLSKFGYVGTGLIQAFFPVYPLLVAAISQVIESQIISGLLISFLAFVGVIYTLYLLVKLKFDHSVALWSCIALLSFPTSFYFGSMYTESLFLFFVLQSFYWYERKKWLLLAVFITLASATRLIGIALVPVLLIDLGIKSTVLEHDFKTIWNSKWQIVTSISTSWKNNIRAVLAITSGSSGLLGYMTYLAITFGDPLYFYHVQEEFGGGREERVILFPQVVYRAIKILFTVPNSTVRTPIYIQELLAGTLPIFILLLLYKKFPKTWVFFSLFALLLPSATGTFSSMPRYMLVAFPIFVSIGMFATKYPKYGLLCLLLSTFALVFNTILFIQGYWVA